MKQLYSFVLFLSVFSSIVITPLYAAGETNEKTNTGNPNISDDERKSAFIDVRTSTSKICADKHNINTKAIVREFFTTHKTDTQGINTNFSKLMDAYSQFNPCLKVTKNTTSYTSDIKDEITIDIVLSRFVQFHASYPIVTNKAQEKINQFINMHLHAFRKKAQDRLKAHQCYYLDAGACVDDATTWLIENVYIDGKAWYTPSRTILNVYFITEKSNASAYAENAVMLFDAKDGTHLLYDEIFIKPNKALEVIATTSVRKLQTILTYLKEEHEEAISTWKDSSWSKGASPMWKNYQNIAFDNKGNLLVFFNEGQVGPNSYGNLKTTIDLQDIEHLLKITP